jgi:hypothetical protein
MKDLTITVNGVEFQEIPYNKFILHGEEDLFPFINSVESNIDPVYPKVDEPGRFPFRTYQALIFNGKFYAPKI